MTRIIMPHLDRVLQDFERQWQTAARPDLGASLSKVPPEQLQLVFLELLQIEICQRFRCGERPVSIEYLTRFPERKRDILAAFGEPDSGIAGRLADCQASVGVELLRESVSNEIHAIQWMRAEIERSWMVWRDWLDDNLMHSTVPQILERRGQIACLADYLSQLQLSGNVVQSHPDLIQTECSSRDAWGDAMGESYYIAKYGITPIRDQNRTVRSMTVVPTDSRSASSEVVLPIEGITEFGRQHATEPNPFQRVTSDDCNRIVIADRLNALVSRRYFSLQLLSPNYAVLTNLSTARRLSLGPRLSLVPGESAVAIFPFSVDLADVQLLFA